LYLNFLFGLSFILFVRGNSQLAFIGWYFRSIFAGLHVLSAVLNHLTLDRLINKTFSQVLRVYYILSPKKLLQFEFMLWMKIFITSILVNFLVKCNFSVSIEFLLSILVIVLLLLVIAALFLSLLIRCLDILVEFGRTSFPSG